MKSFILLLLTLSIGSNVFAKNPVIKQNKPTEELASVWKVQKGEATVYIGGTVHILRKSDFPLPQAYETVYEKADILAFETDMQKLESPKFAKQMILGLSYSDDRTLQSVMAKETFQQLDQYAKSLGLSLNYMRKAKPGLMMSSLLLMEIRDIGVTEPGVDTFYSKKAIKDNKPRFFLETAEEQLNFLANLGVGYENDFYQKLLVELSQADTQFIRILELWRTGQSEALDLEMNQLMKTDYPAMYQDLLVSRNNNWLPKIEEYFQTAPIEFVLVGAAHLVGEDSVLQKLKNKGYQITQLHN